MPPEPREPRKQQVFSITTAATSHSDDLARRQKRYLLTMGFRTVCFVAAVLVSGPMRWVFLAGAVFIPYIAVVIANSGERRRGQGSPFGQEPPREVGAVPPREITGGE